MLELSWIVEHQAHIGDLDLWDFPYVHSDAVWLYQSPVCPKIATAKKFSNLSVFLKWLTAKNHFSHYDLDKTHWQSMLYIWQEQMKSPEFSLFVSWRLNWNCLYSLSDLHKMSANFTKRHSGFSFPRSLNLHTLLITVIMNKLSSLSQPFTGTARPQGNMYLPTNHCPTTPSPIILPHTWSFSLVYSSLQKKESVSGTIGYTCRSPGRFSIWQ